ncbi:MAG: hypothetical protein ABI876_17060 [Bacteroidota bacterium]
MMPEEQYVVEISDAGISCTLPDGERQTVAWSDLKEVAIETNDSGPWGMDFLWVLTGDSSQCIIPQGATGEQELVDHMMAMPGFDYDAFISATTSTDVARFPCWQRDPAFRSSDD